MKEREIYTERDKRVAGERERRERVCERKTKTAIDHTLEHESAWHAHTQEGESVFALALLPLSLAHGLGAQLLLALCRSGERLLLRTVR